MICNGNALQMKVAPPPQEAVIAPTVSAQGSSTKAGTVDVVPVVVGAGSSLVARSILTTAADATGVAGKGAPPAVFTGPAPGRPALQSSRLYSGIVPSVNLTGVVGDIGITKLDLGPGGASLSKKMMLKMSMYLRELDVPETPLPTRAVCDLVDSVKQNTVTLLSLHNVIAKKEKELAQLLAANASGSNQGAAEGTTGSKGLLVTCLFCYHIFVACTFMVMFKLCSCVLICRQECWSRPGRQGWEDRAGSIRWYRSRDPDLCTGHCEAGAWHWQFTERQR